MKILEIRKEYEDLTSLASKFNRQCVFAAIAALWLFLTSKDILQILPPETIKDVLFWFALSIFFDILQYFSLGIFWYGYYQWKKCKAENNWNEEETVNEPEWFNNLNIIVFWLGKFACSIVGFTKLACALF